MELTTNKHEWDGSPVTLISVPKCFAVFFFLFVIKNDALLVEQLRQVHE